LRLLSCLVCRHHAPSHLTIPQLGHVIAAALQAAGKVVAFAELPGVLAPCTRMPGGTVYQVLALLLLCRLLAR
jgi:hypothetical protein